MKDDMSREKSIKMDIVKDYRCEDESRKRFLAYYNLISRIYEKTEVVEFTKYKWNTVWKVREKSCSLMSEFILGGDIVVECMHRSIPLDAYKTIIKHQKPEEEALAVALWQKVIHIMEKEQEWEKSTMQFLNELAETHPLISKVLVAVLSGVLIGLLTNCISEGITLKRAEVAGQVGQKIAAEAVIEPVKNVLIEKYNGEECYKILYFTEEGIPKEGYIHKNSVDILYGSSEYYSDKSKRPE